MQQLADNRSLLLRPATDALTSVEAAEQQLLRDRLVAHHTRITNIMAMVGQLQQQRQQRERSREREQPRQATTPQPPQQQQQQQQPRASAKRASSASLLRGYELESRAEPAELPVPLPPQYAQRSAELPKVETPLSKLWADLERGVLGGGSASAAGRDQQGGPGADYNRGQAAADEADSYLTPTSATASAAAEQQRQSHSHSQISSVSRRRRVAGNSSGDGAGGSNSYGADLYGHRRDTHSTLSPRLRSPVGTPAVSTVGGAASSTQGGHSAMTTTSPPWYPPGTRPQRSVSPPPDRTATTTASRRATSPGGSYLGGDTNTTPYRTRTGGSSYHVGTTPAASEPSRSPYRASVRRTAAGHSEHASDTGAASGAGNTTPNGSRYRTPYLTMLQDMTYLQYGGGTAVAAAAGSDGGISVAGATAGAHSSASSRQPTPQQRREQQQQGQAGTIRLVGGTPAGQGRGVQAGSGGGVLFASPRALNILGASVGQPYVDPPGPVFMPSGVGPAATSPRA